MYILIGGILLSLSGWGQVSVADSLLRLSNARPNDSVRVDLLNRISELNRRKDSRGSIGYAEMAVSISDSIGYKPGLSQAYFNLGTSYLQLNFYSRSLEYFELAIPIQKGINSPDLPFSYNAIALIHSETNYPDQALFYFDKAIEMFLEMGDASGAVMPKHNKAVELSNMGEIDLAMEMYHQNLLVINSEGLSQGWKAATLNNIGNMLRQNSRHEEAMDYFRDALAIKTKRENWFGAANTCNNMGRTLANLGKFSEAESFLDQAKKYADQTGNEDALSENIEARSVLAEKQGNFELALQLSQTFHDREDSLEANNKGDELETLLAVFKDKDQRLEIDLLMAESQLHLAEKRKKNSFLIALSALLLLFLGAILGLIRINRLRNNSNKMLAEKNFLIDKQRSDILEQNLVLAENNKHLEDLNREKDGLIDVVAHDLKAPLNKTLGLIELVGLTGNLNKEQKQFVEMVKQVNENAARLVRDLLDLNAAESGLDPVEVSTFDLGNVLLEASRLYKVSSVKKDIDIVNQISLKGLVIHSRKDYMMRVLDNLISNAVKFSSRGKIVTIGMDLSSDGKTVNLWVQDQGPGISPEDLEKMFGKFQKLSARPTGGESSSGLGLAIVKTLAEKLGGEINVSSQLGVGSRFTLSLPAPDRSELDVPRIFHPEIN